MQFFNNEPKHSLTIRNSLKVIKETFIENLNYLMSIENKPDEFNLFMCSASLVRLQNTFKSASLLIKSYLHFEVVALQRIILEQLAWIFTIHNSSQLCTDINPTSCVKNLKKLYPSIGRLYGQLSKGLHISSDSVTEYVRLNEEDSLSIHLTDITVAKYITYILFYLLDVFCVVGEYIYSSLITDYRFIHSEAGTFKPNKNRITKELMEKYKKELINK